MLFFSQLRFFGMLKLASITDTEKVKHIKQVSKRASEQKRQKRNFAFVNVMNYLQINLNDSAVPLLVLARQ